MTIGQKIKRLREQRGMQQDELAELMQLNGKSVVSRIENGTRDVKQNEIVTLSKIFGVSFDYLLGSEDNNATTQKESAKLGEKIRELRISKGMQQDELAELMGFNNKSIICKIEQSQRKIKQDEIVKLSKIFGVSFEYLLESDALDFKGKIKQLRVEKGMSQKELAELAGYETKTAISYIENGKRQPTIEGMQRIAKALGTTTAYLVGDDSDENARSQVLEYAEMLAPLNPTKEEVEEAIKYIKFQRIKDFLK